MLAVLKLVSFLRSGNRVMKGTNGEQHAKLFHGLVQDDRLTIMHAALYGFIYSLSGRGEAKCYASNDYLCKSLRIKERALCNLLHRLEECGYITRRFKYSGKKITQRSIFITPLSQGGLHENASREELDCIEIQAQPARECKHNLHENAELIDKGIDKLIYKGDKSPELSKKFKIPTLEEVTDYCRERNNTLDAQNFIDFYSSKGWLVGKNKMKDWQACIRTWETNDKKRAKENANKQTASDKRSDYASNFYDYDKATDF
jgi:hypothetical protein